VEHQPPTPDTTTVVTVADIASWADIPNATYQTRAVAGQTPQDAPVVSHGLSMRTLLVQLGIDPASVSYTSVVSYTSYQSTLSATSHDFDDVSSPAYPFLAGLQPAFWTVGVADAMSYIRPLRDAQDVNGSDYLQSYDKGELDLTVHTAGSVLNPTITAAPSTINAGQDVAFVAGVSDADPSETLSYMWTFGDGVTATTSTPTAQHRYAVAGSYYAYVTATGSNTSFGLSPGVLVTVRSSQASPTPKHTSAAATRAASRGSGAPENPRTGPQSASGSSAGVAAPTSSGPAGPPRATSASSGTASDGRAPHTAAPTSAVPSSGATAGNAVAGYLLAGFDSSAKPVTGGPRQATAASATHHPDSQGWRGGGWALLSIGILALLGFGIAVEARRPALGAKRRH
jgi:hypothetical protein